MINLIQNSGGNRRHYNGMTVMPGHFYGFADGKPAFWSGWTCDHAIYLYTKTNGIWSAKWVDEEECPNGHIYAQPEQWAEWYNEDASLIPFFA